MSTTYTDLPCLDCGALTTVASQEPEENQRCIKHWQRYLKDADR